MLPARASADELAARVDALSANLDLVWVLIAAALVFLMQAGFMCLESGLARAKNSINVAVKNLSDLLVAGAAYWAIGFGLMFGASQGGWFGTSDFLPDARAGSWAAIFFVFQAVFCGTAATIDSGAVAERLRFGGYLALSLCISAVIYPVFGHWAWGGFLYEGAKGQGWLEALGFLDFAGSTVVHSVGGWAALAGIWVIGPRLGRFDADGTPRKLAAHNLPLAYLGTFLLFFGWFGFNCGSTLAASADIAPIAMNTLVAGVFGGLAAGALSWRGNENGLPEAETIANGVLGGLVGITAGCAFLTTAAAALVGLASGATVYAGVRFVERVLVLDDVVGAVAVHGFCGALGTLAVGVLMPAELLERPRLVQIGVQALGVASCFVWTFGVTFACLKLVDRVSPLRVPPDDERRGLNVSEHGASSSILELATSMQRARQRAEYDASLRVDVEAGTEVGDLAESFNAMLDALDERQRALVEERERLGDEQARTKSLLDEVAREKDDALAARQALEGERFRSNRELQAFREFMDGTVATMKSELGRIQTDLGRTGERAAELGRSVRALQDAIQSFRQSMTGAAQRADDASQIVVTADRDSQATQASVAELQRAARSISEIVDVIQRIASQTRLLSLNAKIEAASAGDAGRGFAVVSDEVRVLAQDSSSSATRISEQVGEIQAAVASVTSMIEQVTHVIGELREINQAIAATMQEKTDQARQLDAVAGAAERTADAMRSSIDDLGAGARRVEERLEAARTGFLKLVEKAS